MDFLLFLFTFEAEVCHYCEYVSELQVYSSSQENQIFFTSAYLEEFILEKIFNGECNIR
jgi:hypothetical protein